jgi:hypothetical protein
MDLLTQVQVTEDPDRCNNPCYILAICTFFPSKYGNIVMFFPKDLCWRTSEDRSGLVFSRSVCFEHSSSSSKRCRDAVHIA